MRTRSRLDTEGKAAGAEAPVLPPSKTPRSNKKRKAPTTTDAEVTDTTATLATDDVPTLVARATPSKKSRCEATDAMTDSLPASTSETLNSPAADVEKPKKTSHVDAAGSTSEACSERQSPVKDDGASSTESGSVAAAAAAAASTTLAVVAAAPMAPKGRCVSGRVWKSRKQSQRASMQVTTATETLSTTWAKKLELKAKRQAIIAMEQEMKDRKRQEIEDKKQEKLEREKRRQQNEMKNTTYQTISKTHKMKTMSKKQLRQIKKRQVNSRTGEIEFVSPWGGSKKKS